MVVIVINTIIMIISIIYKQETVTQPMTQITMKINYYEKPSDISAGNHQQNFHGGSEWVK